MVLNNLLENIISPAILMSTETICKEAHKSLVRYNINAAMVTKDGTKKTQLAGYITYKTLRKALLYGLENVKIKEYMVRSFDILNQNSEILEIKKKFALNKQKIIPVVNNKKQITGVITKTDLANFIRNEYRNENFLITKTHQVSHKNSINSVTHLMKENIEKTQLELIIELGNIANSIGYNLYLVGGFVRDFFLCRKNNDIDFVVEGNGIELARIYANKNNTKVITHEKFCTATIVVSNDFKVDIASSRMENYNSPASLPIIEMSSIKMDLSRRDFTINALAIQVNPKKFGKLIDFFSAQQDIQNKEIKVIHNMSFVEDPTRVFRAFRFEQRFNFTIEKVTSSLIKNIIKIGYLKQLSAQRIFNELKLILQEKNKISTIIRLFDYGLIQQILPVQENKIDLKSILDLTKSVLAWQDFIFTEELYEHWAIYFMVLLRKCDKKESYQLCSKIGLSRKYKKMFCETRFKTTKQIKYLENNNNLLGSKIFNSLSEFKTEEILYMMIISTSTKVRKKIYHYQIKLRNISTNISGKDLMSLGLRPSPKYRYILRKILIAKLDGKIKSLDDEIKLAKTMII